MKILALQVSTRNGWNQQILDAFEGKIQPPAVTFESPALLFKTLSGKRWDLLQVMAGAGPMDICEVARQADRGGQSGSWRHTKAAESRDHR